MEGSTSDVPCTIGFPKVVEVVTNKLRAVVGNKLFWKAMACGNYLETIDGFCHSRGVHWNGFGPFGRGGASPRSRKIDLKKGAVTPSHTTSAGHLKFSGMRTVIALAQYFAPLSVLLSWLVLLKHVGETLSQESCLS